VSNPSGKEPRPRRATRQREAGEATRRETRRRILAAATAEFAESGYAGATVVRIADRADVAVPTLYSAWGSKRALLRGVMALAVTGNEAGFDDEMDRSNIVRVLEPPSSDGITFVSELAHGYRLLAERAAVGWATYRDGAGADKGIADDWQRLQEQRRETFRQLLANLPTPALRRGLTIENAIDTAWAIASPETHELFVRRLGWSYDRYEAWVAATLSAALIAVRAADQPRTTND
jgi:AcrR family transcriptional regulator